MSAESLTASIAPASAEPFVLPIQVQLRFNCFVFHAHVDGITHEESLRAPGAAGNCLNWVVGHLVGARQRWLAMVLGAAPAMDPARFAAVYTRGSGPLLASAAIP